MVMLSTEQQSRKSWTLTGATVACVAALYVPCVQKTVPGGDSGTNISKLFPKLNVKYNSEICHNSFQNSFQ